MFEQSIPDLFRPHLTRVLHFGISLGDLADVLCQATTWEHWCRALEAKGEDYLQNAYSALSENRWATAIEAGLRAATCFHYAQFKLPADEPVKQKLQNKLRQLYTEIAPFLSPAAQRLEIPFRNFKMAAYLRMIRANAPCVILINGLDSTKEVELHHFSEIFLRRDINTLTIDGPGQGESLSHSPLLPGFEAAISHTIDYLESWHPATIGVFGVSFGAHLAARVAAADKRIAACISLGGFFDSDIFSSLPAPAMTALRKSLHLSADQDLESLKPMVTLEPLRHRLDRPFFIVHGQNDHLVSKAQVEAMATWASGPVRLWILENAEHVCTNRFAEVLPALGDWMQQSLLSSNHQATQPENFCMSSVKLKNDDEERESPVFVDLSVAIAPSCSERLPVEIERVDHRLGARHMSEIFGIPQDLLPQGQGWAGEKVTLNTHAGTHMDAPWHYGPVCNGHRARTIDEVPLTWCYGPGVVLDLRHKPDGSEIALQDLQSALSTIPYRFSPGDIVLVYTGASQYWGTADYPRKGAGLGRDAIFWLVNQGIRIIGTDAWGIDRSFEAMSAEYRRTGDPKTIWPAHFAGREVEYCQLEKLRNLDRLPPVGFTVVCFPVSITNASAGWVRAVAIMNRVSAGGNGKMLSYGRKYEG